jgi:hypothetical protein
VLDRDRGHVDAEHAAGLARVVAGGDHHVLAGDVALGRGQPPLAARRARGAGDGGLLVDLRAAVARALPERHRQIGRRDVTVVRVVQGADDVRRVAAVAEVDERPQLLDLARRDHLEGHADRIGRAAVLLVLVHPCPAGGEAQVAGHVEADVLTGLRGQALVQVDRVLVQLPDRIAHVKERQQAGGVPGGARRELGALEQHDVGPALLRQVIERGHADDPAADHHHPGMRLHLGNLRSDRGRARPLPDLRQSLDRHKV